MDVASGGPNQITPASSLVSLPKETKDSHVALLEKPEGVSWFKVQSVQVADSAEENNRLQLIKLESNPASTANIGGLENK